MQESNRPTSNEFRPGINEDVLRARIENLKLEQNLGLGMIGGAAAGLVGAVLWAAVTYLTEYQIGWLALGVGILVGLGVRWLGKGIDRIFGIAGGVIALVSVVLGNFLTALGYVAKAYEIGFLQVLQQFDYSLTFELMKVTFTAMDLLFYGLAVYAGYRYSFRKISREQLLQGNL
jgi:hypothetical protein